MPNGFHGTGAEWDRIESPLHRLDDTLARFADERGLQLRKNTRNWPDRRLEWNDAMNRSIQIRLVDDKIPPTYAVGIYAWQDRAVGRYIKGVTLVESAPIDVLEKNLGDVLKDAASRLDGWTPDDLEYVGPVP
ncbi:MAG: hypothetical protein KJO98_02440 [Rhodothermia bacterium]|nr:hypothetical protein [Rhodothermia bacterium]